jgi:hypothetical protein
MSEKDTIHKARIKHRGLFDFKDLYEFLYDYLIDENYDIMEGKYVEKIKGKSKDVEIKWEAAKEVSDYFRFVLTLDWVILGMKSSDVEKEGKKITIDDGDIEIRFKADLVKDYESRWEHHPFWLFLRGIYDKYIIRTRVEEYEEKLFGEIMELLKQTKSFLAIETTSEKK